MKKNFLEWTTRHHNNLFLMGLITFTTPQTYLKAILKQNQGRVAVWGKKACLTLSFDCDYEEDIAAFPTLVRLLNQYHLQASFACVGNWIERFPEAHLTLLENEHEIVNHTYSHPDNEVLNPGRKFRNLPAAEKLKEIEQCHEVCQKYLNYEPTGCRIPHFRNLFTPDIYTLLKQVGYRYSSSTWLTQTPDYGFPFKPVDPIWEFPLTTCPKHPFTVFDTWHSFNSRRLAYRLIHRTESAYLSLFKQLIDWGIDTGSYINVYLDPLDVPRMKNFRSILEYITARENELAVLRYQDLVALLDRAEKMN